MYVFFSSLCEQVNNFFPEIPLRSSCVASFPEAFWILLEHWRSHFLNFQFDFVRPEMLENVTWSSSCSVVFGSQKIKTICGSCNNSFLNGLKVFIFMKILVVYGIFFWFFITAGERDIRPISVTQFRPSINKRSAKLIAFFQNKSTYSFGRTL